MTNKEAIETLRANYPDDCYEQLREAVDVAINALTAQPDLQQTCNKLETDTISRRAAIDIIEDALKHMGCVDMEDIRFILGKLPSAQPEQLTDTEQRIFLAAMAREELICLQIDKEYNDPNSVNLVEICHEITRKVKNALWTI